MSEPVLRPFKTADASLIVNRDGVQCTADTICWQAKMGPAFTAELDGHPIGCAGVVIPWPGVGQAWMVLSDAIEPYSLWMYRNVRHMLDGMVVAFCLHRMEAVALLDEPRYQRWLEGLGFTSEKDGVARGLLPDRRSMKRYEWIKGD